MPDDGDSMSKTSGAYLDYAATTPMRAEAVAAMLPFLSDNFANPSGVYSAGRAARRAIDEARETVAELLACAPGEVIFTSGGTEADNLAVLGVAGLSAGKVVTTAIEHHAVLNPARRVEATVVVCDPDGRVDLDALSAALDDDVALVSVMSVNNELGTLQPLGEVVDLVRRLAPGALVHTDAVQAAPWFDLGELCAGCDLVSISAHKIGGPKGVGALAVRGSASGRLAAILAGGGQERSLRPGTENVAGIAAFAAAAKGVLTGRDEDRARVGQLRDRFLDGILSSVPGARASVPRGITAPGFAHLRFEGVVAEELLVLMDEAQVAASAGSACSSGALEPSHVLGALGWDRQAAREAIRFTLGRTTSNEEVAYALGAIPEAVKKLSTPVVNAT
jgi:cysteine desulfurase